MTRGAATAEPLRLRIARVATGVEVLGPGRRAVVWFQGCRLRCGGCLAPEWLSLDGGTVVDAATLAADLASSVAGGLTLSGGEPFLQAAGACELIDRLRLAEPGLTVMSFTGYRVEYLRRRGTAAQRALLERLDLLVDGPYVERWHGNLRWRGSRNQRILRLSDRHPEIVGEPDVSAGIEVEIGSAGSLELRGVPAVPRFRPKLAAALALDGILAEAQP